MVWSLRASGRRWFETIRDEIEWSRKHVKLDDNTWLIPTTVVVTKINLKRTRKNARKTT